MCNEASNGAGGCNGHEHGHECGDGHSEVLCSEDKPPGLRLGAGKGLVFKFVRGLPPKMLSQELHFFRRFEDVCRYGTGFYLDDMSERLEHDTFGSPTAEDWAAANLDMDDRTARERRQVVREMANLPETGATFKKARLRWSKLRLITRVATAETQGEWLECARKNTVRKLASEVKGKKKGTKPRKGKLGTPCPSGHLKYQVSMVVKTLWDHYMEQQLLASPPGTTPEDILRKIALGEIPTGEPVSRPLVVSS